MNPGQFNKKIQLMKRTITKDEYMQEIETFELYASPFAMVRTIKSSEAIKAGNLSALKETRFVVRYSKKIAQLVVENETHFKLIFKSEEYEVKSIVNDDEQNKTFTIVAERSG